MVRQLDFKLNPGECQSASLTEGSADKFILNPGSAFQGFIDIYMVKDFFLRRSFKIPDHDDSVILKIVCLCSVSPVTNKCPTVYLTEDT